MGKMFDKVSKVFKENEENILTTTIISGVISTGFFAYRAGLKANDILKERKEELSKISKGDKERRKEINKKTAKKLIPSILPPVLSGGITVGCAVGMNKATTKKVALLTTAYNVTEKALTDTNNKMVEMLGEKKTQTIKDAITKDKMEEKPPLKDGSNVIITNGGDSLCRDSYTGRYFKCSALKISQAINDLSAECASSFYVSLNEFYDLIDLERIPYGDDIGWNTEDMIKNRLPISYTAQLTSDDEPCLCIDYEIRLNRHDFRDMH